MFEAVDRLKGLNRDQAAGGGEESMRGAVFVFFFQAEDGIRDYKVTGVQTCALPISRALLHETLARGVEVEHRRIVGVRRHAVAREQRLERRAAAEVARVQVSCRENKIGRASCRERV